MSQHLHAEFVEGCYRCDLSRDEVARVRSEDIRDCRSYVLSALIQTMEERSKSSSWVENERMTVAVAANEWVEAHGYERRVTVADVKRVETNAMGHVDYASKLALYVAEFVIDPADWQVAK